LDNLDNLDPSNSTAPSVKIKEVVRFPFQFLVCDGYD
jgi:hypothetical protein